MIMDPTQTEILRRHFFSRCSIGLGSVALTSLLSQDALRAADTQVRNPLAPQSTHFPARAKSVIFLFMAGGPSQLEMFENKPKLTELSGQPIPDSFVQGKRFAFMNSSHRRNLLGTRRSFRRHGESGAWVSDLLPWTAQVVDDLSIVTTCKTELFNHAPAKLFMNTGSGQFGRPSMGSWVTYGIGSECEDLPGFVVLQSGPRGPRGGSVLWGSGMLPSTYQGVPLRNQGEPILNLTTPKPVTSEQQKQLVDATRELNLRRLVETGDEEIATRINAFEMAHRMQTSAPELIDIRGESRETLDMYGIKDPNEATFARNCLLARRLVERGVRFIQLYDTSWDHHGGSSETLEKHLPAKCQDIDQPGAALIRDLKRRGLLDETIVIWGGEFGRTPMGEVRQYTGRNHHIDAFTMWLAGGGIQSGQVFGETDEFGFGAVQDPVHVHDLHATVLHLLGMDHERLTVRFQGRDFRLTDVHGKVVRPLLA
ncbi:MAG TPA: sulfatase [Planctomycetaceae bacterium]|nr:sulfatase [Blastopirellula sp.]HAY82667.1 sulfatase [Planctomycetaceae bacterium]